MLRAIGYPLLFLAMFSIAGGHWAVMQTVAWTGMILEYSKESPLTQAISKTFSGEAPCEMCKSIESGKQKESKLPVAVKSEKTIDAFCVPEPVVADAPDSHVFSYPLLDFVAAERSVPPPAPVPIAA